MGFSSVCCKYVLLPLVNKEAALAYGRAEYSKVGNPSRNRGGKKVESGKRHVAAEGEGCQNLTGKPQPCSETRLRIMGLFKM